MSNPKYKCIKEKKKRKIIGDLKIDLSQLRRGPRVGESNTERDVERIKMCSIGGATLNS